MWLEISGHVLPRHPSLWLLPPNAFPPFSVQLPELLLRFFLVGSALSLSAAKVPGFHPRSSRSPLHQCLSFCQTFPICQGLCEREALGLGACVRPQ